MEEAEAERLRDGAAGGHGGQGGGIYYSGFTVITRRGRCTRAGNGVAYVGCVYPICAERLVCFYVAESRRV